MDFYSQSRQKMIDKMQLSLKPIRQVLNLGVQEFGDIIGLTRQSINNLENCKVKMNVVQFLAICAVIDHFMEANPQLRQIIITILNSNDSSSDNNLFDDCEDTTLLKKWFLCFPDYSKVIQSKSDTISDLVENYIIFLDDTTLCEFSLTNQITSLITKMEQSSKKFIIPLKAVENIQNRLLDKESINFQAAQNGISNIRKLQELGIVEIRGEKSDVNIFTTLVSVFVKYKLVYRLALITQNPKLAKTVMLLNNDEIGGFQILVLRCLPDGVLQKWDITDNLFCQQDIPIEDIDNSIGDVVDEEINEEYNILSNDESSSSLIGWETI